MRPDRPPLETLKDGTFRQIHPVTGEEVWNVPGRAWRPKRSYRAAPPSRLETVPGPEGFCDFCESRRLETPPEKSRWWLDERGKWRTADFLPAGEIPRGPADFRRIANLFEIVTYDYWAKNLGFKPHPDRKAWRDAYLADPAGRAHVEGLIRSKARLGGIELNLDESGRLADLALQAEPLFFGSHELIVAGAHFRPHAEWDHEVVSSGDLDPARHRKYIAYTADSARDILAANPKAQYVAVFQNWLSGAGASFEHLHKQLAGLDRPGPYVEQILQALKEDPSLFNRRFLAPALERDWVVASNRYAVAVAAFGTQLPSVWVFSLSGKDKPWELSMAELDGFSDLLHACHAAMGSEVASNEEWVFSPPGEKARVPFHVTLKWRTGIHAGFEGATRIFINPLRPEELRDRLRERLEALALLGRLGDVTIGGKVSKDPLPE